MIFNVKLFWCPLINNRIFIAKEEETVVQKSIFYYRIRFATGGIDNKHNMSLSALDLQPQRGGLQRMLFSLTGQSYDVYVILHSPLPLRP